MEEITKNTAPISDERRHLFKRRVTADLGFPEPDPGEPDKRRVRTVARLPATDAALKRGVWRSWIDIPGVVTSF